MSEPPIMRVGMSDLSRKIREARKRLNLNQTAFAQLLGVSQGTVSKWESGNQEPELAAAMKLAELMHEDINVYLTGGQEHEFISSGVGYDICVVGSVQSNYWTESIEWDKDEHLSVQIPFKYDWIDLQVKGFVIKDEYTNQVYPRGSIVFCAYETDVEKIGNYDRVLVIREHINGLFEVTVRQITKYKDSIIALNTLSKNPDPSQNFSLKPLRLEENIKAMWVAGVVIASFITEPKRETAGLPGFARFLFDRE